MKPIKSILATVLLALTTIMVIPTYAKAAEWYDTAEALKSEMTVVENDNTVDITYVNYIRLEATSKNTFTIKQPLGLRTNNASGLSVDVRYWDLANYTEPNKPNLADKNTSMYAGKLSNGKISNNIFIVSPEFKNLSSFTSGIIYRLEYTVSYNLNSFYGMEQKNGKCTVFTYMEKWQMTSESPLALVASSDKIEKTVTVPTVGEYTISDSSIWYETMKKATLSTATSEDSSTPKSAITYTVYVTAPIERGHTTHVDLSQELGYSIDKPDSSGNIPIYFIPVSLDYWNLDKGTPDFSGKTKWDHIEDLRGLLYEGNIFRLGSYVSQDANDKDDFNKGVILRFTYSIENRKGYEGITTYKGDDGENKVNIANKVIASIYIDNGEKDKTSTNVVNNELKYFASNSYKYSYAVFSEDSSGSSSGTGGSSSGNTGTAEQATCLHSKSHQEVVTEPDACGAMVEYTKTVCDDCSWVLFTSSEYLTNGDNHLYGDPVIVKEATDAEKGIRVYTCTRCGFKHTEYYLKKNDTGSGTTLEVEVPCSHADIVQETSELPYSCGGKQTITSYVCTICGKTVSTSKKSVVGNDHTYGEWTVIKEATNTEKGIKIRKCTVCGSTQTYNYAKQPATPTQTDTTDVHNGNTTGGSSSESETNTTQKTNQSNSPKEDEVAATDLNNNKANNNNSNGSDDEWTDIDGEEVISKPTVKTPDIKKISTGGKKIKVALKKVSKAKGYEVQISRNKKFKSATTKTTSKKTATFKKLKKKKYYIRVRSYKVNNKKKVFSKWSKVRTIKVK